MENNTRIYIGTLYSGENELEESIESVKRQNYTNWTHELFKYLPNKEIPTNFINDPSPIFLTLCYLPQILPKNSPCLSRHPNQPTPTSSPLGGISYLQQ